MRELRRIDGQLPFVAPARGREPALRPQRVAAGDEIEHRLRGTVAVDEARVACDRDAGHEAVRDDDMRPAARRREPGVGVAGRRLQHEVEVAFRVESIDAARQQRVGRARPPRRRIEVGEGGLARGAPRRVRSGARESSRERRARCAGARLEVAQLDLARRDARVESYMGETRRGFRQAPVDELAGEVGAHLDDRLAARARRAEAGSDERGLAGKRGIGGACVEGRRPHLAQLGFDVPAIGRPPAGGGDAAARDAPRAEIGDERLHVEHARVVGPRAQLAAHPQHRQPAFVPATGGVVGERDRHDGGAIAAAARRRRFAAQRCQRRGARERRQVECPRRHAHVAERPGREWTNRGAAIERLRGSRRGRRDACRGAHVERLERTDSGGVGLPGGCGVDRRCREPRLDREGRVGGDRRAAGRTCVLVARFEGVEAMALAAVGAEVDAGAQVTQGRCVRIGADAQLVDAHGADLDLDRQAQGRRRRRGLAAHRRGRCRR